MIKLYFVLTKFYQILGFDYEILACFTSLTKWQIVFGLLLF